MYKVVTFPEEEPIMNNLFVKDITVTALGGVGSEQCEQVTTNLSGSCFLIKLRYSDDSVKIILVDCGLHQGTNDNDTLNHFLPFDISKLSAVLLTHAHVDHSGRIPWLYKQGFRGHTYASSFETLFLSHIQQKDCANIFSQNYITALHEFKKIRREVGEVGRIEKQRQKSIANSSGNRGNKPTIDALNEAKKKREQILMSLQVDNIDDAAPKEPLYSAEDVEITQQYTKVLGKEIPEVPCVTFETYSTGHILGARSILLTIRSKGGKTKRIVFSGDLGTYDKCFQPHGNPVTDPNLRLDAVFCETTYGGIVREKGYYSKGLDQFMADMNGEIAKGKTVIVPAFAMDRSQEILYHLRNIKGAKLYYESKTGVQITNFYEAKVPLYRSDRSVIAKTVSGAVYQSATLSYIQLDPTSRDDFFKNPSAKVVVTSSGMCDGGPVVAYLEKYLSDPNVVVMLTGYMSPMTLGGKLLAGQKSIRLDGKFYEVRAKILHYNFWSAHGDESSLLRWLEGWRWGQHAKIYLNHGGVNESTRAFKHTIERKQASGETTLSARPVIVRLNKEIPV
jgi:metallo-beta-lactamase family protein